MLVVINVDTGIEQNLSTPISNSYTRLSYGLMGQEQGGGEQQAEKLSLSMANITLTSKLTIYDFLSGILKRKN